MDQVLPPQFTGVIANTPLLQIKRLSSRKDIEIYAKLEGTNLGGSVKDRAALAMITAADQAGHLNGKKIVEATSGNTGIALAMIASLMNHQITLIMPETATKERVSIMRAYGAEVCLVAGGMVSATAAAAVRSRMSCVSARSRASRYAVCARVAAVVAAEELSRATWAGVGLCMAAMIAESSVRVELE